MKRFFLLFMISAIVAFFMLGSWQVKRLLWKNNLIMQAQQNSNLPASNGLSKNIDETMYFSKVNFAGKILGGKRILVVESYNKEFLYRVYAPVLIDNQVVVVDFGLTNDKAILLPEDINSQAIIFKFDRKNILYPANQPDKHLWYNLDYASMKNYFAQDIAKFYLKITPSHAVKAEMIIKPFATSYRNDHLAYAITWFALCLACSTILYFRLKS